jgi:hypothetical protein
MTMTCYCVPALAFIAVGNADSDAVVVNALSDQEMAQLIGANGSVDADVADYKSVGGQASAVFANRSTLPCTYALNATDINGNVLEVLQTGTLNPGEAAVAVGVPTVENANAITGRIWNSGVPGLESIDFSIAN